MRRRMARISSLLAGVIIPSGPWGRPVSIAVRTPIHSSMETHLDPSLEEPSIPWRLSPGWPSNHRVKTLYRDPKACLERTLKAKR